MKIATPNNWECWLFRETQLSLKENPEVEKYVRAEIFGPGEVIMGTQPFGIR